MSEIRVCVGMIASGKSTYTAQLAKDGWIVLNDDSIVSAVHGGDYTLYDKSLKPLYKSIENTLLTTAVAMGKNVVIDRGVDISIPSRARWIAIGRSMDVKVRCVCFEWFPPEVHALRRFESDSRGHTYEYWLDVAKAHQARWHGPSVGEGFFAVEHKKWV